MQIFRALGTLPPHPHNNPSLQISGYAPALRSLQFTKKHTVTCQGPKRSSESTVNKVLALF